MNTRATLSSRIAVIAAAALTSMACTTAHAEDSDCFPLCPPTTTSEVAETAKPQASCESSLLEKGAEKAESLNNKLKPAKEIAGYIRSPQGLAMKMVNDHVVKIPAWVGYAVDPVGSLKNRAIGEVRSRVKEQLMPAHSCSAPAVEVEDNWDRFSL